MMISNSLVKIKEAPPYTLELEERVLLNPTARATLNPKTGSYEFPEKTKQAPSLDTANVEALKKIIAQPGLISGVGVDQG